jgi:asparagine synthase (glutamine-hydrolysing)
MCGIAGIICPSLPLALEGVRRINAAQVQRGPNDTGIYSTQVGAFGLALGHQRLSIQDLSDAGHQPMVHVETGNVIVYNGELYNVAELRGELLSNGARFRSRSDTEVILEAFAQWGPRCAERFHGMFAFALWCPATNVLHVVRDPLGIKPLYLAETHRSLILASELRAILATGAVDRTIDRQGLASLFAYGAVAAPHTMIEGVRLLEPGTWSEVTFTERLERRSKAFWRFPVGGQRKLSAKSAGEELREPLERAVRTHVANSDVPVGVFLSSGIDSTAVAALAAHARGGDLDTFCVSVATDSVEDESHAAALTAALIGSRHHEVRIGESEALKLARSWLMSTDQPTIDGLNTFVISRAVRERGIVVALSGVGGDEMFGGYSTFTQVPWLRRFASLARLVPSEARRRLATRLAGYIGGKRALKVADLAASNGDILDLCLLRRRLYADVDMRAFGFGDDSHASHFLPPEAVSRLKIERADDWATVRNLETALYMSNTLLRDTDVFGMAHGLEIRVPLLDRAVIDCALSWSPAETALRPAQNKAALVAALGDRLPRHVLSLPKRGFSLPQTEWLAGPLRAEFSARVDDLARSGLVDSRAVRLIWSQCPQRDPQASWARKWLLGALGAWIERLRGDHSRSLRLVG